MKRLWGAVEGFFLEPASARPVSALRIGLASVLLAQALLLRAEALDLLAGSGIVQMPLATLLGAPHSPRISWFLPLFAALGIDESGAIYTFGAAYLAALVFLLIGYRARPAAVATFLLHWILVNSGYTTTYGVDMYAHLFLFYLMWVPCGDEFSLDRRLGRVSGAPSVAARLGLRVMQLHLAMGYLVSAAEKAQGPQWWNGELLWRALNLPEYRQFDFTWLVHTPWLAKLGGWATLIVEGGYVFLIWPRATRRVWIALTVGMHVGIATFLGLETFGALMAVLTPALFGFSAEPEAGLEARRGEAAHENRAKCRRAFEVHPNGAFESQFGNGVSVPDLSQ